MRILPFVFLAACAAANFPDHVQDETALIAADSDFAKDSLSRGVEAWVSRFDKTGARLEEGELTPAANLKTAMAVSLGKAGRELHWVPEQARASGDLGYTIGRYTLLQDGKDISHGRYLTIWRREGGAWKIVLDTSSEAQPVSVPAPHG